MTASNLYKLLDKLELIVLKGIPVSITPMVIIQNHEKLIDMLDKIRASVPGEIQEANNIIKKRDDLQLDAQKKANQLLTDAKQQADLLLSESELLKAVQSEAERIRQIVISECEILKKQTDEEVESLRTNSINEAIAIREGANKYAETILSGLDRDLAELHEIVRNGQKHLAKAKSETVSTATITQKISKESKITNLSTGRNKFFFFYFF